MRPREQREAGEQDLFRSRLDQIIDINAMLAAVGYNFHILLMWLSLLLRKILVAYLAPFRLQTA